MNVQLLVARNIRRLRVARKISQEGLALDSDIDRTYVSRLERALENPTVAVLSRVSNALQADIRDLFDPKPVSHGPVAPLRSGRKKRSKARSKS